MLSSVHVQCFFGQAGSGGLWQVVVVGGWDPIRVVLVVLVDFIRVVLVVLVDPIRLVQTEAAALDTALVH